MAIRPEPPLRITPEMLLSRRIDFERRMRRLPPVTAAILVLLVAIFGLQGAAIVLFRQYRDRLLLRDRRIGFVLLLWAIYAIVTGLTESFIDNGAHIGGALGGAVIAWRLHPVVLSPLPPEREASLRVWLWVVGGMLAYGLFGWLRAGR